MCEYLLTIVVTKTFDDFIVSEGFRHASFRTVPIVLLTARR
jgi:hypothetical protein